MLKHNRNAQSLLEFTVMVILIIAVFISMNSYVKRGFQGRLKGAIDDFGDQYDPSRTEAKVIYTSNVTSNSSITTQPAAGGYYTQRDDHSRSIETRTTTMQVNQEDNVPPP